MQEQEEEEQQQQAAPPAPRKLFCNLWNLILIASLAPPPMASRPAAAGNPPFAIAQYDYVADEGNEISFAEGERLSDIEATDENWWTSTNAAGERGLHPANYVQLEE